MKFENYYGKIAAVATGASTVVGIFFNNKIIDFAIPKEDYKILNGAMKGILTATTIAAGAYGIKMCIDVDRTLNYDPIIDSDESDNEDDISMFDHMEDIEHEDTSNDEVHDKIEYSSDREMDSFEEDLQKFHEEIHRHDDEITV